MSDDTQKDVTIDPVDTSISEDVQNRLNQVLAQVADRDQAVGEFSQQVAATNERIARIEAAIQQIAAGVQAPSQPKAETTLSSLLKPAQQSAQSIPQTDIASMIRAAVEDAVKPLAQKDAARDAQQALLRQQEQSFAKAAKILPGLKNEDSKESALFDRIIDSRKDLSSLPDAPLLVATMVQGLLSEAGKQAKDTTKVKQALTHPSPGAVTSKVRSPSDIEEVREMHQKLLEKGRDSGLSNVGELANLIRSQLTLQVSKED